MPAGTYTLKIANSSNSCTITYGPIIIKTNNGPNISEINAKLTPTPCGQPNGSITNLTITGTGTLKYSWKNEQNQEVGTSADLINQPAGKYTLQVTDETNCGPVYSSAFEILEINGVSINDLQKQINAASCNNNNGSITGIQAPGATHFEWFDSNNQLVGSALNLNNVLPGKYHLIASNATCNKISQEYIVAQLASNATYTSTPTTQNATCNQNNGSITVIFNQSQPQAYRWENNQQQTISNTAKLESADAGTYRLYITDNNGCESAYQSYTISRIPVIQITPNSEIITNDECGQKVGRIKGITFTGGEPPYTYQWANASGGVISNSIDLINATEGSYQLHVTDATGCTPVSKFYMINNQTQSLAPPDVNNLQICTPGSAMLSVTNPATGYVYRVYDTPTSTTPIDEQTNGKLRISVKTNQSFYVSQLIGNCESMRTEVQVTVGLSALSIANTFSPNGDGINDIWTLSGIENYTGALVQIYNRYGEKVFESKGYSTPFNGNVNGQALPAGTYYYIINLSAKCNLLSGSLTLIR